MWKECSAILILIVRALVVVNNVLLLLSQETQYAYILRASSPLGDKEKTRRARGDAKAAGGGGGFRGYPRAARFARPNRRACSQASTLRTLLPLASGSSHDPFPSNVVPKDNLLAPFLLEIQKGKDVGVASFTYTTLPR